MRNSLKFIAVILATVAAASCAKEIAQTEDADGLVPVTFTVNTEPTKSYLDGLNVKWSDGDKVAVYDKDFTKREFTATVAGETVTISGEVAGGTTAVYCVYPFSAAKGFDGSQYSLSIGDQVIPAGRTVANDAMISVADGNLGGNLNFRNVTSLVKFRISEENFDSVLLCSDTDLTGDFTVSASGTPLVSAASGKRIAVKMNEGYFDTGTSYYMAIVPARLEGFTIVAEGDADVKYVKKTIKQAEFVRNSGLNLGDLASGATAVPMVIYTKAQLDAWADNVSYYTADDCVKLGADINYENGVWTPLSGFKGDFDGQDHSIYNIEIDGTGANNGFFATLDSGNSISNLKLGCKDSAYDGFSSITVNVSTATCTGGLVGSIGANGAAISNVINYVSLIVPGTCPNNNIYLGGIAGMTVTLGESAVEEFINCTNHGTITASGATATGTYQAGGIIGQAKGKCAMTNCDNTGDISFSRRSNSGTSFFGGIIGRYYPGGTTIEDCDNSGSLTFGADLSATSYIGGILAADKSDVSEDLTLSRCSNTGNVSATGQTKTTYASGILALAQAGTTISLCTNEGDVVIGSNTASNEFGAGIVASVTEVCTISECENYGDVRVTNSGSGKAYAGGLVGRCSDLAISTCAGCKVECSVSGKIQGIIIGAFHDTINASVWGTSGSPIHVAGSVGSTTVTGENYSTLLCGANGGNATFYVSFGVYNSSIDPIQIVTPSIF